jgi:hypothetical protein
VTLEIVSFLTEPKESNATYSPHARLARMSHQASLVNRVCCVVRDALMVDCDPALTRASRKIIAETKNVILVSAASAWEIVTGVRLRKLATCSGYRYCSRRRSRLGPRLTNVVRLKQFDELGGSSA